jgi:hypothetical protein
MDHRIIPIFRAKKPKKLPGCRALGSPAQKLYLGGFSSAFLLLLFCHLQSSCTMILIIGLVASHLREEGVCMHKTGWGAEWIFGIYYFLLTRFFFHSLPISHTGRVHLGISSHGLGNASSSLGDPRLSAQTLGSRDTYSFLHRIGMERSGGRAWDIHLFSTFESTTTRLKKWLSRIRF